MTKVDECTNAEIGVGAAIAIGSQGEKGYKALFVIKVKISMKMERLFKVIEEKDVKVLKLKNNIAKVTKKKQSPKRFISKVNKPDVIEDWFW